MDGAALPLQLPAPAHIRRYHGALRLLFALPVVSIVIVGVGFIRPTPYLRSLNANGQQPLTAPVEVGFSWPISRTLQVQITPHVEGQVLFQDALVQNRLVRTAAFVPDRTWQPGTTYTLAFTGVQSAMHFGTPPRDYSVTFTTEPLPVIASVQPKALSVLRPDAAWTVTFDRPPSRTALTGARLEPFVALTQTWSSDGTVLTLRPATLLAQSVTYTLFITRTPQQLTLGTNEVAAQGEPEEVLRATWSVREPPGMPTVKPEGTGVALHTPLVVTFAEPVDTTAFTAQVQLHPAVVGTWASPDGLTFTLQPEDLQTATTYTLTIPNGLRTKSGGVLDTDSQAQFRTVEPIALGVTSPAAGAKGVGVNPDIRIAFNQAVQHANVAALLQFSPAAPGTWQWVGEELRFTPARALSFGTAYTLTVAQSLLPVHGLPATGDLTLHFTTELAVTRLAVPFHRQEHALSCEAAALFMALRYRGVDVTEGQIIERVGFDPTPKKNGVWGDPNIAFVGDINGSQPGTGYGVYAAPIAKAAAAYRTGSHVLANATLRDVLTEVREGNPVVAWGNASTGKRVDWKTSAGVTIPAIVGEHARVVIGFVGSVENPSVIITQDPLYGERRFSKAAFLANWELMMNLAVVVD